MGAHTIGPIPDWTINDWCERSGYDEELSDWFAQVIHLVDANTLEKQRNNTAPTRKRKNRRE